MILYDFTEYITDEPNDKFFKCKVSRFLSSDPDVFRKEYPSYVKNRATFFRSVFKNPKKWKKYLKKYHIKPRVFKIIGDLPRLTDKYVISKSKYHG